jgi:hypothetical protein
MYSLVPLVFLNYNFARSNPVGRNAIEPVDTYNPPCVLLMFLENRGDFTPKHRGCLMRFGALEKANQAQRYTDN